MHVVLCIIISWYDHDVCVLAGNQSCRCNYDKTWRGAIMELWRGDPRLAQCILDNGALLLLCGQQHRRHLIKQLKEIVFTNFWKLPNWMKKGNNTGRNGQNMLGQMEISKFAFRIPRHLPPVATKNINHWHGSFMISMIWCEMGMKSCLFHPFCYWTILSFIWQIFYWICISVSDMKSY